MYKLFDEVELNRLLRRVDWRFLLGTPTFNSIKCFTPDPITQSLELISDAVLDHDSGAHNIPPELVVTIDPTPDILMNAYNSLAEGGALYAEFNLNRLSSYKKHSDNLRNCGFNHIEFYMTIPPPSDTETHLWIPLASKQAMSFTLKLLQQHSQLSKTRKISARIKNIIWNLFPNLIMNYPILMSPSRPSITVIATAEKPILNNDLLNNNVGCNDRFSRGITTAIKEILGELGIEYGELDITKLMITIGDILKCKVVLFVFSKDQPDPLFVLKVPRTPKFAPLLMNEEKVLNKLNTIIENHNSIPKVLYSSYSENQCITAQTYLAGSVMPLLGAHEKDRSKTLSATNWLIDLANNTTSELTTDWKPRLFNSTVDIIKSFLGDAVNQEFMNRTLKILNTIQVPNLVCEHRDLSPTNLLITDNDKIHVIDWEDAELRGLPVADLLYFMTIYCFDVSKTWSTNNYEETYNSMLRTSTEIGDLFAACMNHYTSQTGIDNDTVQYLRVYTWVTNAASDISMLVAGNNNVANLDQVRNNIYVRLWELELSRQYGFECRLII